jgi:hypothetical protein
VTKTKFGFRVNLSETEFEVAKAALQFRVDYLRSKEEFASTTERIECLLIEKQLLGKKFLVKRRELSGTKA